jgi:plasmid stabilization system protein ParE
MIVRINRLAQRDIDDAAAFYCSERVELANQFLSEVELAVSKIAVAPYQFEEFHPGMRRIILDRFPYSICYRMLDAQQIEVVVVKHHRRRPSYGMRRK